MNSAPSWRERFAELGIQIHPAADQLPEISEDELAVLGNDIVENGLRHPVVLYCARTKRGRNDHPRHEELQLIDGRNRLTAMEKAGICLFDRESGRFAPEVLVDGRRNPVEIVWRNIGTGEIFDPVAYIISANIHRRHLDESQRALVAAKIATLQQGTRTDLASIEAKSQREAADLLNVGRSSVQRARTVIESGAPNVISAVERGEVPVSAAANAVRAAPKDVQQNWSVEDIKRVGKEAQTGAMREQQAALPAVPGPPDAGRVQSAILNAHLALKAVDNADLQAVRKGLNADQIAQAIEHIDASLGRLHKLHAVLRGLQ